MSRPWYRSRWWHLIAGVSYLYVAFKLAVLVASGDPVDPWLGFPVAFALAINGLICFGASTDA